MKGSSKLKVGDRVRVHPDYAGTNKANDPGQRDFVTGTIVHLENSQGELGIRTDDGHMYSAPRRGLTRIEKK